LKIVLGSSTRAADGSSGLGRALATANWTSAHLPLQTLLPLWTRRTLRQQLEPPSTIYSQVSIFSIYESPGLFFGGGKVKWPVHDCILHNPDRILRKVSKNFRIYRINSDFIFKINFLIFLDKLNSPQNSTGKTAVRIHLQPYVTRPRAGPGALYSGFISCTARCRSSSSSSRSSSRVYMYM
jgi:hypothetical protein